MTRVQPLLVVAVATLIVLSGCGMFGGSSETTTASENETESRSQSQSEETETETRGFSGPRRTVSDNALLELVVGTAVETQNVSFTYETRVNTTDGERIYTTYGTGKHELRGGVPITHTVANNRRVIGTIHASIEEYHTGESVYRRTEDIDDTLNIPRPGVEVTTLPDLESNTTEVDEAESDTEANTSNDSSISPAAERITIDSQHVGNVSIHGSPIRNATISNGTITNDVLRSGVFSNQTRSIIVADVSGLGIQQLNESHDWADDEQDDEEPRQNRSETILGYYEYVLSATDESEVDIERNGETATLRFDTQYVENIYPYLGLTPPGSQTAQSNDDSIRAEYRVNTSTYHVEEFRTTYNTTVETANGTTPAVVTTTVTFDGHGETTVQLPEGIQIAESDTANNSTTASVRP